MSHIFLKFGFIAQNTSYGCGTTSAERTHTRTEGHTDEHTDGRTNSQRKNIIPPPTAGDNRNRDHYYHGDQHRKTFIRHTILLL